MNKVEKYVKDHEGLCVKNDTIPQELFEKYGVKKGLRDLNGQGVLTGLTNISQVRSFDEVDGKKIPCDGELLYRGYDVRELVKGGIGQRYIFEEGAYLLLFGELPDKEELAGFKDIIFQCMTLPTNFTRDVIMKAPGADIMNSMTRSILTLASYDPRKDILTLDNGQLRCSVLTCGIWLSRA